MPKNLNREQKKASINQEAAEDRVTKYIAKGTSRGRGRGN